VLQKRPNNSCVPVCCLFADPDVEYAEPNFKVRTLQATPWVPNDLSNFGLWGMTDTGAGAKATSAWAQGYTDCSDVVIDVIGEQAQNPFTAESHHLAPVCV
jgi:hypothetical protein